VSSTTTLHPWDAVDAVRTAIRSPRPPPPVHRTRSPVKYAFLDRCAAPRPCRRKPEEGATTLVTAVRDHRGNDSRSAASNMEPPGTVVRTAVSPGHARPSGPKLSVLFREVIRSRTATLASGGAAGGGSVVVALAGLASWVVGRRAVAPAWRLSAPYLAACPGRLGLGGRPAG
jgi:hypothetical protein